MAQEYGTDLIALEKPALMHPAFFGYLTLRNHRPACDPAVLHPIFFNHKHIVVRATAPPQPSKAERHNIYSPLSSRVSDPPSALR